MSKKREALTKVLEDVMRLMDHNQLNESKDDKVARSLKARIKENLSNIIVQEARDILHESGMDDSDLAALSDDPAQDEELLLGGDIDLGDAGDEISKEEMLVDDEEEPDLEAPEGDEGDDFDLGASDDDDAIDAPEGDDDDVDLGDADLDADVPADDGDLDEADTFLTQEDIDAIERELDGYEQGDPEGDADEDDFSDISLDDEDSDDADLEAPSSDDDDDSDPSLGDDEDEDEEWKA